MSSLKNAPSLSPTVKKGFSFRLMNDDDDYIGTADTVEEASPAPRSTTKAKKKSRDRGSKDLRRSKRDVTPYSDDEPRPHTSPAKKRDKPKSPVPKKTDGEDKYDDDFEQSMDSDDYIPSVSSPPTAQSLPLPVSAPAPASAAPTATSVDAEERHLYAKVEAQLKEEKAEIARKIAKWESDQAEKGESMHQREEELRRQITSQQQREEELRRRLNAQVEQQVEQKVAAATAAIEAAAEKARQARPKAAAVEEDVYDDDALSVEEVAAAEAAGVPKGELQRRRRREHERAVGLRRAEEGEAAHSLFQRLAQDVREVFHELNLSVVAAEKERLIKDERYRRERELKDRREEMARAEKLEKELKEREEREAKYWAMAEQRDEKLRTMLEGRMGKDEEEREARLKRDLEDRATRLRNERELRDEMEKMEKERRAKAEEELRGHDNLALQSQLEEMKTQYRAQVAEMKRQMEADAARKDELQKSELNMIMKRHDASLEQLHQQHRQQLSAMEGHTGNASRIEALVANMQDQMEATKAMNEKLLAERQATLQQKERQLEDHRAVLDAMTSELKTNQESMTTERARVAGLYAKFELAVGSFNKNGEEDRRTFREAQAHYDTLRQQAEKDRRLMLSEVAQERKLMEQQFEEFLARKMEAMAELQGERVAIARERSEASLIRERQNRDETDLLKSLRSREEEFKMKLEATTSDREAALQMREEQKRLHDSAAAERQALREEREQFDLEKEELLTRFDSIRRQAEDAAASQGRLQLQFTTDRGDDYDGPTGGGLRGEPLVSSAASRLQMDLARQRAILQNIG